MSFIKSSANKTPIVDTVFSIVKLAKQDIEKNGKENVVDATLPMTVFSIIMMQFPTLLKQNMLKALKEM